MMKSWKHIFKLDPAKELSDDKIDQLCQSGTDAIIIGGTDGVTYDKVESLLEKIQAYALPCLLEVSTMDAIVPGFDYYFIPMVMNSTEKKWMMDIQHKAIKHYKPFLDWGLPLLVEGYCILNEDCKAFKKTNCKRPDQEDVIAYAYMAEHFFSLPIFYIEYSGMYGDPELVAQVKDELKQTLLFYGGGIVNHDKAREMKKHADVIIVGNIIYDDFVKALETVTAVK